MHAGATSEKGSLERSWDYLDPRCLLLLVRMSSAHIVPVTLFLGLANRFGGFTCLKVCYYFNSKRPYEKHRGTLEITVQITPVKKLFIF